MIALKAGVLNRMNELVSVIVPIYNKEKTIIRCVESIINQTYTNLEILLIDDGSTDSSAELCKKLEESDHRIHVFRETNSGPGCARNLGINQANGKYITFVDADDYLKKQMIEELCRCADKYSADLVICGYYTVNCDGRVLSKTFENSGFCDDARLLAVLNKWNINPLVGAPWNKLYKRSIISDNNIRFPINQTWAEDLQYNLFVYMTRPIIYIMESCLYNYVTGGVSLTSENISSKEKIVAMPKAIKSLLRSYLEIFGEKDHVDFQHVVVRLYRFSLRLSARTLTLSLYYSFIKDLMDENYLSINTIRTSKGFSHSDILLCRLLSYKFYLLLSLTEKIRAKMVVAIKKLKQKH